MSLRNVGIALVSILVAGPAYAGAGRNCALADFTGTARNDGWIVQELTDEERLNFLSHLNNDNGARSNFYPPHLWETVRKGRDDLVHIRIVFLDGGNCVLGNSGEIAFDEFSYLLAADVGY